MAACRAWVAWAKTEIKKLKPLERVMSFQEWVDSLDVTLDQKNYLVHMHRLNIPLALHREGKKKGFSKNELYSDFKRLRGIAAVEKA